MAVTIYVVVGPASGWTDPSAAEVKAGQLAGGGAATWADSTADPGGTGTINWPGGNTTGLTPGASYRTAYVVSDGATDRPVSVSDVWAAAASVALASTGGAGTFAGIAGATSSAALAVTGASGAFAGSASSPAVATLAATGSSGTLAATASSHAVAALAATWASGAFAGSSNSITSAALAAVGASGAFAGSASVPAGTAGAAEVWSYVMSNGYTAEQNVVAIRALLEAVPVEVLAAMNLAPPGVDVRRMNGAEVIGTGAETDPWRGVGVSP